MPDVASMSKREVEEFRYELDQIKVRLRFSRFTCVVIKGNYDAWSEFVTKKNDKVKVRWGYGGFTSGSIIVHCDMSFLWCVKNL